MYIEIHPYHYTPGYSLDTVPMKELYQPGDPVIIRLDTIRKVTSTSPDSSCKFVRLCVSDDHLEDLLVLPEEGDLICKKLLAAGSENKLSKESEALTAAVRSLWELLRARMR